ncbi:ABC transporter permease subunit [Hamadaea tsunoensis]|uniref:ABC transporter permease subunit n=1 Tax=Hamadaea tsunoensis TaxID=53368 RepID=UPI0003F5DDA4|nr:ATP-binding cassette domain-containing protein [Hamadaea tsunoensis]
MIDALVLGLFTGLTYGLLAVGLVLVYRSSRFLNFAHGSIGVFGAAVLAVLVRTGLGYWAALPAALLAAAAIAALVEAGVVRRLAGRPPVTGMIVTLGLSQFLLVAALLIDGGGLSGLTYPKPPGLPTITVGRTPIGPAFVAMALLTPVVLGGLALFLRRTRYGLGIRAAADAPETARLNGVPAHRMASFAWGIAGAVAAFSAILVTPTQGTQSVDTLGPDLLLRGLAGAVAGRMTSLPKAFAASLAIGVGERLLLAAGASSGVVEACLAGFVLVVLLSQPRLGRRDAGAPGWLRPPAAHPWAGRAVTLAGLAIAAGLAYAVSNDTASALTSIAGFAVAGLSVLIVTGLAGELSLGQFAYAGIGAAVSLHVAAATGRFVPALAAGCAAGALAAVLVGLPALRLRGLPLAATTLAFALATSAWLLRLPILLGDGVTAAKPSWGGYPLDLAKDYYLYAVGVLGLALWLTYNVRRSGFGRVLIALRENEDAARAFTVGVPLRRLQAYALAGALAGLGGAVIGHGQTQVTVNSFPASAGIDVVALVVVGGLGLLGGPVLGAILLIGLPALLDLGIAGQAALTLGWLAVIVFLPDGLGGTLARLGRRLLPRRTPPPPEVPAEPVLPARTLPVPPADAALLRVRGVARSFGGVQAVSGVDLDVRPGEIVGIIGPNGAGKTTFFEIVAGFTRPASGTVTFAGRDVTTWSPQRRARLGLARSFQDARLFATLSVREALMVAGERRHPSGLVSAVLGAPGPDRRKAAGADRLIALLGLGTVADQPIGQLSTGTRRFVELACLLALEPALLLLDEPSSGVAQADGAALADLLLRINAELGVALVVIEHDLHLLARLADRLVAMESGRVIADGPAGEIRAHPEVVAAYLGGVPLGKETV